MSVDERLEEVLADLIERGFDPADADRVREATAASPLRQEIRKAKEREDRLIREVGRITFQEVGIATPLDVLNLPDDLDVTDAHAVRAWALSRSLIPPVPEMEIDQ